MGLDSWYTYEIVDTLFSAKHQPLNPPSKLFSSSTLSLSSPQTLSSLPFISSSYPLSYYAVDAVLALAQAVNDTLSGWSNNSPDWSFCEGEESEKKASISKCFVKQKLLGINIQGLTVSSISHDLEFFLFPLYKFNFRV